MIVEKLKLYKAEKQLYDKDIAKMLDVSVMYMSKIMTRRKIVTDGFVKRIRERLVGFDLLDEVDLELDYDIKKRKCLSCDRFFISVGKENRICHSCKCRVNREEEEGVSCDIH